MYAIWDKMGDHWYWHKVDLDSCIAIFPSKSAANRGRSKEKYQLLPKPPSITCRQVPRYEIRKVEIKEAKDVT